MNTIYLTKEIDNKEGYVDEIDRAIRNAVQGEPLNVLITCTGGDVYQGSRLQRSIMSHDGPTKATVIGLAASMAGVLLGAFDEVELDEGAEIMLHKAHIANKKADEMDDSQTQMCNRFNAKAYNKMVSRGVNEDFLNEVFLSDSIQDYWLNAKEAEALGIGKVTKVVREDSKPSIQVVNKIKDYILNNKSKSMGLFDKPVARIAKLADGRAVAFSSVKDEIQKGDRLVTLDGSVLTGKVRLSNNLVAEVNEKQEVVNMEEVAPAPMEGDAVEKMVQLEGRIAAIEEAVAQILEKVSGGAETEMKAKEDAMNAKVAEAEAAVKNATEIVNSAQTLLNTALGLTEIKSTFKPGQTSNLHETIVNKIETSEERGIRMRNALKEK